METPGGADVRIETGSRAASSAFLQRFSRRLDLAGLGPSLARSGRSRRASRTTRKDVRRAQKLRYRVFFEEGGATPDPTARLIRRDVCRFDRVSDHLVVVDRTHPLSGRGAPDRRRLSPVAAGRRRSGISASTARANSTSTRWSPGVRTCASSKSAAPASRRPIAASACSNCSGAAFGPMRATTGSTR